jgi:endonuclease YncB( thermonuclease family)
MRQRVEALLNSHVEAGSFLGMPIPERLLEVETTPRGEESHTGPGASAGREALSFLAPSDKPGSLGRLGHYEVLEVVGRGGMGIVLKAFDEKLHRVVAIKLMAAELASSGTARQRFIREARAAAAVSHEHLVTIHAVEEDHRPPYLVMQFIDGVSLQQKISEQGALSVKEILRIGLQTASGLAAAHAQGVVHRDIKPANILLENGVERVKITDFGLARVADEAFVTQTSVIAGTPQYMAPEQAEGKTVDHRSDLFSLGSVLYAMCTGLAPFRGSTTVSILKRVCEEMPQPIREVNRDVPQGLVAIIEKLHAKDPAKRFQSAQEVADLLERELAGLQHPAGSQFAAPVALSLRERSPGHITPTHFVGAPVMATLMVLVVLGAALLLTEGLGITRLVATVVRTISPPGNAQANAKPGDSSPSAGKQASPSAAPAVPATADAGPFVVLGGAGVAERKFDTLAEAVQSAVDGDTIEIRGNGPFVSQPIKIAGPSLVIRAGEGFRPVIKFDPQSESPSGRLLDSDGSLVLEGLEIQDNGREKHTVRYPTLVLCKQTPLQVANCRFLIGNRVAIGAGDGNCQVRNCEVLSRARPDDPHYRDVAPLTLTCAPAGQIRIDNCVIAGHKNLSINFFVPPRDASIRMTRTVVLGGRGPHLNLNKVPSGAESDDSAAKPVEVELSSNLLDLDFEQGGIVIYLNVDAIPPDEAKALLQRWFHWRQDQDVFSAGGQMAASVRTAGPTARVPSNIWQFKRLEEWQQFWQPRDIGVLEGTIRYQGGDLRAKLMTPDGLTPADFRLRPDSVGYHAGQDGKDLGPDLDLVGPGAAYERWKKTPEYQEWLKETGQLRAETPMPQLGAFVLLAGGTERKFDTLADAVQSASDGDTIEVRGNGPFLTRPIAIQDRALVIRAGEGFRPVIQGDPNVAGSNLLNTRSPLVLEGLDFRWVELRPYEPQPTNYRLVSCSGPKSRLNVSNCRFLMNRHDGPYDGMNCVSALDTGLCRLRNSQFLFGGRDVNPGSTCLAFRGIQHGELMIDNCLIVGHSVALNLTAAEATRAALTRSTILGSSSQSASFVFGEQVDSPPGETDSKLLQMESSANILDGYMQLSLAADNLAQDKVVNEIAAGQIPTRLIGWRENRNLYVRSDEGELFKLFVGTNSRSARLTPTIVLKTLSEWQRFWGLADCDSQRGLARFHGGNLIAKAKLTPELLVPDDFRLREGGPGYKAGKDGKDLGADVDLVGPGAAYERWKKTPEYQGWLKETGQEKE